MNETKINQTLEQHEKRLDEFGEVSGQIIDKLTAHDQKFDTIERKLQEHDGRFDRLEAKLDSGLGSLRNDILTKLDQQMVKITRIDQERIFTNEAIKRLEKEVTQHSREINKIKKVLKIS